MIDSTYQLSDFTCEMTDSAYQLSDFTCEMTVISISSLGILSDLWSTLV